MRRLLSVVAAYIRPLLALVAVTVCVGSVAAYTRFLDHLSALRMRQPVRIVETPAEGRYSVEVTLTFDAAADAFALDPTAVLVQFRGQDLLKSAEPVAAGAPLSVDDVPNVVEGRNEFFVRVTPADEASLLARAVRVRVLRDDVPVAEQTLWSEPGEPVQGVVVMEVRGEG